MTADDDCHVLDTSGSVCPEPLMLLYARMRKLEAGACIRMYATDPSTQRDIPDLCRHLGHRLLSMKVENGTYIFLLRKKQ